MRRRVMSSLLGRTVAATLPGLLMVVSLTTACAPKSPTEPGSAGKTPSPSISIVSLSVASETLVSGAHVYRVIVKLRESGGAAATIGAIDLSFSNGSSAVVSSHVERPISDAANVVAPNSTIDSRQLMTIDDDPSHAHATTVSAKVTYTDGGSMTSSATASSDVPLSVAPTFTLSGIVSEENTAGRAVAGGTVQVVDGPNAGKSSSTDGNGSYTLTNLAAGSFSIRASAHGYNATERSVTVAQDTRLDLRLLRTPVSPVPGPLPSPAPGPPPSPAPGPPPSPAPGPWYCVFSVIKGPQDFNNVPSAGGQLTVTVFTYAVPPTSSSQCSVSTNSNVSWISGGGTTVSPGRTLTLTVAPNSTGAVRNGSIVATGSPAPAGTGSPQTIAVTQR